MTKRILALFLLLMLCFASAALAKDADIDPGLQQGDAATIKTGVTYHCQASNQPLWFRFKASASGPCTVTFTSLSLRYYGQRTNEDLLVPVVISNRYGVTASYTNVTIPNNNAFQPAYAQDGVAQPVTFQAESGTEYYICVNIGAAAQAEDRAEGFFTLSLCTEKTHELTKDAAVLTAPTCEAPGVSGRVCTLCTQPFDVTELPALGHAFGEETVFAQASCTQSGMMGRTCQTCGKEETTAVIDAPGHLAGTPVEVRTPTCTEDGNLEFYCTVCGELIQRETTPALGHQPDAFFIAASASCEKDGLRTQHCTVCAALLQQETLPAPGHIPGVMQVLKAASCTENGYAEQRCTVCNVVVASQELPAPGHVAGEFVQVRPYDVMQTGLLTSTCQTCGTVLDSRELPAIGRFLVRMDHPARFHSIKNDNLSVVRTEEMAEAENGAGEFMTAYFQGDKLTVEEAGESKRSNLAYVPFTVSVCVPAKTCFVATYTFDMTASKRASNGSALMMAKLIDLGYADIPNREVFDPGALASNALISMASGEYRSPASGSAVVKVAFNNDSDEPQIVDHYFALFAGVNYASTYAHRLLTELTLTATLEEVTPSHIEANLVDFINSLN